MAEQEGIFFVSAGIAGSAGTPQTWATYIRKPNGALRRVVSKALPLRATQAEAENDLLHWLIARLGRKRR